jgi:hypothetical protein
MDSAHWGARARVEIWRAANQSRRAVDILSLSSIPKWSIWSQAKSLKNRASDSMVAFQTQTGLPQRPDGLDPALRVASAYEFKR